MKRHDSFPYKNISLYCRKLAVSVRERQRRRTQRRQAEVCYVDIFLTTFKFHIQGLTSLFVTGIRKGHLFTPLGARRSLSELLTARLTGCE